MVNVVNGIMSKSNEDRSGTVKIAIFSLSLILAGELVLFKLHIICVCVLYHSCILCSCKHIASLHNSGMICQGHRSRSVWGGHDRPTSDQIFFNPSQLL